MSDEIVIVKGVRCVGLICGTCGVAFAMPEVVLNTQREEGGFHTCPNGHSRGWNKSASRREEERRAQERLKQSVAQKDDEIAELQVAVRAAQNETKKLKKRTLVNGVCPCCTRSFVNLKNHMKTKHPDYAADAKTTLKLVAS